MKSPGQLVGRLKPVTTVPLLMVCLGVVLTLWNPPFLEGYVETLLVDLRFKVRNLFVEPAVPDDIVIVAVDERSLAEYGRVVLAESAPGPVDRKDPERGPPGSGHRRVLRPNGRRPMETAPWLPC